MKRSGVVLGAMVLLAVVGFSVTVLAGNLDPPGAPAPTMKTLDQIPPTWSIKLQCDTSQNCPRFVVLADFANEAVLDKETGLVWQRSLDTTTYNWQGAQIYCFGRSDGQRFGWRVPAMEELSSILPFLPAGHPFANIQASAYWSATTLAQDDAQAWTMNGTTKGWHAKTEVYRVWCVRGGQGYDGR
ncbi:MAG TPA: DUF1566 domain-containing protein [Candidatus Methylomirabilis sp.]|nr:DUF1566 domain-containing protein [Candidatus Methylomirabilis sp.]